MTRPRLIATDLDGTFLRPDGTVSAINAEAAARANELGVPFVIATGRPTRWLGVLAELATAHPQVIVSNGGAVVELATGRPVHQFPLDSATAFAVADALRAAIPGITFGFETGVGFGCEPDSPSRQRSEPGHHTGTLTELSESLGAVIKLLGFHPEIPSEQLTTLAAAVIGDQLNLTHASVSQPYGMIELTAPGVSKASTLALVCAELGIAAAEVVAFGDMPNDAEMLTWAGQGFVVANGHHSMKVCGFTEVPSNAEDGVGLTILELLS
ncbi:HAD family hydrolase [Propionicimonas sp.]|uniref:HAD family hydrolase n=1 Tax=Propionicimonas sp. TaxID=1955623 RepID=UPI001813EF74|nr:HAD family hydrolase [Propionicimonas sp.]MBU3976139.1 Cof-type HAD-IIB family hydrolase [Actinomycetota bacterium]MBA3020951.1 HAD family phosphatase [Propionicimonas sp.]MBU3985534.1 Cof-type HAD-IIB family hydrolase [Actinomycetota bacterium]MBU4008319.1 Cof-type HAD-IIB family hydrolase [Actinomycetota bacterium]MBU4066531.1 Cof-type HAD-IIB family hydrolase [Actinomycetota bacterium]